ncbi:MAG: RNA polymerase sigma factor [Gammaproteobacteria bacterium]|nr:RNA polymerase sigma factor [Gammaproteobacteria bacterium]
MNDKREMERLSRGDIPALGTLVRRHQTKALRAAYLVTHDLAQAEDVVSSAFLRVYERAEQFDSQQPFGPWFYTIVVNDAINAVRRRNRTTTLEHTGSTRRPVDSTDPEATAVLSEERKAVRDALSQLTPSQRGAVVMRYFLELSESEMVERTGRSRGTVKRHLHDARARMKQLLRATMPSE